MVDWGICFIFYQPPCTPEFSTRVYNTDPLDGWKDIVSDHGAKLVEWTPISFVYETPYRRSLFMMRWINE